MKTRTLLSCLVALASTLNAQTYQWSTFAGTPGSAGSTNGNGSAARFSNPSGTAVDSSGNVYVADTANHVIRKITPAGEVSTYAGQVGTTGSTNGSSTAARFYNPAGVAVDSSGNVYVADYWNHTIRKINTSGTVSTLAGTALTPGTANGTGSAARFTYPHDVAVDSSGNVYVADNENHTIRKVTAAGVVTTLAGLAGTPGTANGTGSTARFSNPAGVAVDSSGNVYVGDRSNHAIRKVTPSGVVSTFAGSPGNLGSANGTGTAARFHFPAGVGVDSSGNVYVGDTYNDAIRKITPGGVVTTIGGLSGSIGSTNGLGTAARFNDPFDVAVSADGRLYVPDKGNDTIRRGVPYEPEIGITGNGQAIASGDASPTTADHTDFGSAVVPGGTVVRTFNITNTGWANLNLTGTPQVQISGTHAAEFAVTAQPTALLTLSDNDNFIITFTPTNSGLRTATVTIPNDDADEAPYTFAIQGTGLSPEITVTGNGQNITDGDVTPSLTDHTDYGSTPLGTPVTRSFTVTNTGGLSLNVTGLTVPTGYEYVGTFAPFTLAPAAAQVVQVRFLANTVSGTFSGTMALLSNDVDEGSFEVGLNAAAISGGALDLTFDADGPGGPLPGGKITTAIGSSFDQGNSVAVQSDGKIVVAGYSDTGSNRDFALVRYTSSGALDTSFNGTGKVTTSIGSSDDFGQSVAVQSDGKIVVAGYSYNGGNADFALVRYTSSGALDSTFGSGGKVTTVIGSGNDFGQSVSVQSDGNIVVVGHSSNGSNNDFALVRYTSSGALDSSFNGAGKVTTDFGISNERGHSVAVQSDGKIVVVGSTYYTGFDGDIALVRYTSSGALDTSFNGTGKVITSIAGDDNGHGVALQSDGRIVVAGNSYTSYNGTSNIALVRYTSSGTLDTSFNGTGKITTAIGFNYDYGQGIALQSDGRIVVAGFSRTGAYTDFAIFRYEADLTPTVTTTAATGLTTTTATLNGIVNPNGVITSAWFEHGLTTSYGSSTSAQDMGYGTSAVARAENLTGLTLGTLYHYRLVAQNGMTTVYGADQTFTTLTPAPEIALFDGPTDASPALADGQASALDFGVTPLGTPVLRSLTVKNAGTADLNLTALTLPSGYAHVGTFVPFTLAAGATQTFQVSFLAHTVTGTFNGTMALLSNDADEGSFDISLTATAISGGNPAALDFTFDADGPGGPLAGGKVATAIGSGNDIGYSVVVQSDGRIVVAGYSFNGVDNDFALVRYTSSGVLDSSFGTGGKVTTAIGSSNDYGYSVAVQSDGKILVAGTSSNGSNNDFALVRYTSSGLLDSSFGTGGKVTTAIGNSADFGYSVVVLSDGRILVAGTSSNGSNYDFALVRYTSSGALDSSFGDGGKVITAIGSGSIGRSVAVQSDGKILVAGNSSNGNNNDLALVRYASSGVLDTTFGNGGKVTTDFVSTNDIGLSVALQSDGRIVVAGFYSNGSNDDFALVRYTSSGALDTTFGTEGKVTTAIGSSNDYGYSVALQSDDKIVVAGHSSDGISNDFAVVRYTNSGALDTNFGTSGKVTTDFGSSNDVGFSVAMQSDGKIVVAGYSNSGANLDFAIVRYGADLTPTVTTAAATGMSTTTTTATLNGTVNPNGVITSAWFEWGETTSYGITTGSQAVGYGNSAVAKSIDLTGLIPGRTIHYRLVAQNGMTTVYGADQTFTTLAPGFWYVQMFEDHTNYPAVSTLTAADALIASGARTAQGTAAQADLYGFSTLNPAGRFPFDYPLPGYTGNHNDYAVKATARFVVTTPGDYTFAANTDDGVRIKIDDITVIADDGLQAQADSPYVVVNLSAGTHRIEWVWFEHLGHDVGEVFAAPGVHTSFNSSFKLVGDPTLFGLTTGAPEIAIEQPVSTDLTSGSAARDLGSVDLGTPASLTFTVRNSGTADLTDLGIVINGTNASDFAIMATPAAPVVAGSSTIFTVRFAPTVSGSKTATLQLDSNDADEASFVINLTGYARTPQESWRQQYFGATSDTGNAANTADPDGDGKTNLEEFAFGTHPGSNGSGTNVLAFTGAFTAATLTANGQPRMSHEPSATSGVDNRALFIRRADHATLGLTYIVEFSANLSDWQASAVTPAVLASSGDHQLVSVKYPLFVRGRPARFFRVRVVAP